MRRDFDKGVLLNIAPQRGETAAEPSKDGERQGSPFLSTISFVSSKEIVRTKALAQAKPRFLLFPLTARNCKRKE